MYRSLLQKGQSSKILGNPRLGDKQLQQPQSHEAIFRRSAPHLTQQTPTKTMAKKTTMAATQCPRSSQASQAHGSDDVLPPLVACCALPPLVARTCDDNYTQDDEAKSIRGGAADELAGIVNWDPQRECFVNANHDPLNPPINAANSSWNLTNYNNQQYNNPSTQNTDVLFSPRRGS